MKNIQKAVVFLLSVLVMCVFSLTGFCADTDLARSYERQSYVVIKGTTEATHAGFNADLLLVKADADLDNLTKEDIGYIGQTVIDTDGNYTFEFKFSEFEYDGNVVSNYNVIVNADDEVLTPTITSAATMSDFVSFEMDFTNFGREIAKITNEYQLKDLSYKMLVAFYDESDKLLTVISDDKFIGDEGVFTYGYDDIPSGTAYAKGFIWEDMVRFIPLVGAQKLDVAGHTENREVMMLTIAPGKDESERNFAWYDIPGISDAQIQYAIKTSEEDLTVFPEDNAITVQGTCGEVDVSDYIGIPFGTLEFSHDTDYSWGKATITDLEPGVTYVYRIGDKFGWCNGIYEFKTDESPENGFDFLLFADEHAHYNAAGRTGGIIEASREAAIETLPDASIIMAIGDNVDYPWFEVAYEDYFDRIGMTEIPLAAVPGSTHDFMINTPSATLFNYHFNMPNQSQEGYIKNLGGNYWYTYGDVLFINIMHNMPANLEQTKAFIKKASDANPDAKWKILCAHIPFGIDTEGENRTPASYFTEENSDFIADNGIDLVLSAHTHVFVRSKPMYAGKVTDDVVTDGNVTNPKGVTYINLNTTGMLSGGYGHTFPDYIAKYNNIPLNPYSRNENYPYGDYYYTHFSTAEVDTSGENATTLKITTYQNSHSLTAPYEVEKTEVIDTYTITKTAVAE